MGLRAAERSLAALSSDIRPSTSLLFLARRMTSISATRTASRSIEPTLQQTTSDRDCGHQRADSPSTTPDGGEVASSIRIRLPLRRRQGTPHGDRSVEEQMRRVKVLLVDPEQAKAGASGNADEYNAAHRRQRLTLGLRSTGGLGGHAGGGLGARVRQPSSVL